MTVAVKPDSASPAAIRRPLARERQTRLLHGYLHKTSNSLCGIKGYASLIATTSDPQLPTCVYARRILAEVERMESLYHSVQDVAFPLSQGVGGDDLARVVQRASATAARRFGNLQIRARGSMNGRLLLPVRDLELVLGELLANCAEGCCGEPSATPVRVRLQAGLNGRGRILLRIEDDGPGLPAAILHEAADAFVTTKAGHLGIGLARVDTIMDMYDLGWSLANLPAGGARVELEVALPPVLSPLSPLAQQEEK
jgi:C4-dicarboxylate-specific signal transduction histidine kinase